MVCRADLVPQTWFLVEGEHMFRGDKHVTSAQVLAQFIGAMVPPPVEMLRLRLTREAFEFWDRDGMSSSLPCLSHFPRSAFDDLFS